MHNALLTLNSEGLLIQWIDNARSIKRKNEFFERSRVPQSTAVVQIRPLGMQCAGGGGAALCGSRALKCLAMSMEMPLHLWRFWGAMERHSSDTGSLVR
jgi:hypothetical protein